MVLELHVWGPAFGAPSIDPECLSAIVYLSQSLPRSEWVLISNWDCSLSPTHDFPALRTPTHWIATLPSIIAYIANPSPSQSPAQSPAEKADATAWTAFLHARASPLLDLSFYVSSENYRQATRPAFTAILPWHVNYLIPPRRRAMAKARTEHLGVSGLDVDGDGDELHGTVDTGDAPLGGSGQQVQREKQREGFVPKSLVVGKRKESVGGLLRDPKFAGRWRLDELMRGCFEPLEEVLRERGRLGRDGDGEGEGLDKVDCVALGYLGLALWAEVPASWLRDTVRGRYPRVMRYVEEMRRVVDFGNLPWREAEMRGQLGVWASVGKEVGSAMLPSVLGPAPLIHSTGGKELPEVGHEPSSHTDSSQLISRFAAAAVGILGIAGALAYYIRINSEQSQPSRRFSDMGEAGAALAALGNQLDFEAAYQRQQEETKRAPEPGKPLVEVEVDVDVQKKGDANASEVVH